MEIKLEYTIILKKKKKNNYSTIDLSVDRVIGPFCTNSLFCSLYNKRLWI